MFRKSCNYHYIKHLCDTIHICCNWFDVIEQYHIQNNKIRLPNTTLNIIYLIEGRKLYLFSHVILSGTESYAKTYKNYCHFDI